MVCAIRRAISFKTWINIWILLITRGVEWLALFASGNIISVLLKTKRNHDALEVRNEDWGALRENVTCIQARLAKPCACGFYDLVLLLHLCALPVFREQWQYSVKLPFLIWLRVCISFLDFEFFSRKERKQPHFTVGCTNIKTVLREMEKTNKQKTPTSFRILQSQLIELSCFCWTLINHSCNVILCSTSFV